jgi:hypothetical protein
MYMTTSEKSFASMNDLLVGGLLDAYTQSYPIDLHFKR